jgi:hypothetical protein
MRFRLRGPARASSALIQKNATSIKRVLASCSHQTLGLLCRLIHIIKTPENSESQHAIHLLILVLQKCRDTQDLLQLRRQLVSTPLHSLSQTVMHRHHCIFFSFCLSFFCRSFRWLWVRFTWICLLCIRGHWCVLCGWLYPFIMRTTFLHFFTFWSNWSLLHRMH